MDVEKIYQIKKTDKETLKKWFYLLTLGRVLDDRAPNYLKQAIGWSYHAACAGHDGIQLAIGQVFDKETDHLYPYYRDLLTTLSAGLTSEEIILNGISKASDVAGGGRHMSNHFAKPEWNIHNDSSATGNHTQNAAGTGRAMKFYKHKGVTITSQGESSFSEGYVYEAVNGASTERLPVIFVIQDNGYGISVAKEDQTANKKVADNFRGFKNLRIIKCNGKDVFDSMNAMTEAKKHAIEKQEPVMVHASCVRIHSHSNSDRHELYRDDYELNYVRDYDPIGKFRRMLLRYERFTEEELSEIEAQVKKEVKDNHKKCMKAPDPDPKTVLDHVFPKAYEPQKYKDGIHKETEGEPIRLIEAINNTLQAEFKRNPHTYLWGQDVASKEKGGVFNVSKGLQQAFGKGRVFNAPIAEDYIVGTANGMSRFNKDIRVVVEGAEFADYFWPAMEQYVDSAHDHYRSNGKSTLNFTIRLASGGYIQGGLYHSQTIEGALAAIPGVRIVYPSFADDAAGLLRTSIRSEGMTMYMEPKALYNSKDTATIVPEDFEVPFGKARIRRKGSDMTIVTFGNTTHLSIKAANKISEEGKGEIEVIDLRSIIPMDTETVINSVKKTNRLLVVHEDKVFGGFGGEVSAQIAEEAFEYLDTPIKRVGSAFAPVPFHKILEEALLPDMKRIYDAAIDLLEY